MSATSVPRSIDDSRDAARPEGSRRGTADASLRRPRRRHVSDLVRVVLGIVILSVASLPVRPDTIGRMETGAFDLVNGLPDVLFPVLWGPMQLGSLLAVPLVAIPALLLRRRRLAVDAAVTGTLAWTIAKVVKDGFSRPRPGGLLDEVAFRGGEPTGMGFVSGHTAVAFALATAAVLHLPRRWRGPVFGLAALVGIARIFVGAHLPLDVVGGAALGWAIGSAYRWAVGAPTGRPPTDRLRDALGLFGMEVHDLAPMANASGSSALFHLTTTENGETVQRFVKVVSDRPQDRDRLHRWWLRLTRQHSAQRFGSPLLQTTHEAALGLAACQVGVHTPRPVLTESFDGGSAILVTTWCEGAPLSSVHDISQHAIDDAFRQVASLHRAGLAHGDLRPENLLLTGDAVTLVDFGDGRLGAMPDEQDRDLRGLLVTLADRAAPGDVVRIAARRLGADRVAGVLRGQDAPRCRELWEQLSPLHPEAAPPAMTSD